MLFGKVLEKRLTGKKKEKQEKKENNSFLFCFATVGEH